jgi:putative GTP pyrophosphokinase
VQAGTTTLHPFRYEQLHEAQDRYGEIEKEIADDPNRSVVLVSVDSLADLKAAYPSYYGDTGEFIQAVGFMLAVTGKSLV